ncbi:MAG: DUF2330 domain-containing protein [Planctomycetota bacterium]|nr:DUF2330 domain-containing protein [Planctomycetota bacterium]
MNVRNGFFLSLVAALFVMLTLASPMPACCPVSSPGEMVLNADQTVIMLWDAANKTQHFIRQANFKTDAKDFGFLIPSPSQPELAEAGNDAFPFLLKATEPETITRPRPSRFGCGCGGVNSASMKTATMPAGNAVTVLSKQTVAGFDTVVLQADSADALVNWLKENNFAYSPEIQAWAEPYVKDRWKFTALKVAPKEDSKDEGVASTKTVEASALRMSFKTDKPLFPYREPEYSAAAKTMKDRPRLLRIYFLADSRYRGDLGKDKPLDESPVWANPLSAEQRKKTLELLKLPDNSLPAECWLTEFEHHWPYELADADVYFSRDSSQERIKRPPFIQYVATPWPTDALLGIAAVLAMTPLVRRWGRKRV